MAFNYFCPWRLFTGTLLIYWQYVDYSAGLASFSPISDDIGCMQGGVGSDYRRPVCLIRVILFYVSFALFYLGAGAILNQGWVLLLVPAVLFLMNYWDVRAEERRPHAKFYANYLNCNEKC
jgi:hypothetical protein